MKNELYSFLTTRWRWGIICVTAEGTKAEVSTDLHKDWSTFLHEILSDLFVQP